MRLIFSQHPFPGAQLKLERQREQDGGNWYHSDTFGMDGWLCPALLKFFPRAPQHLYVKAEARGTAGSSHDRRVEVRSWPDG